ncbi:type I restriction-modification system, S subunit [Streptococcus agalactiae]|uniref:restriction endonuclease subunit S n=1 Tax=Streptococcus agalactiae TaxID=1311 RepID=UPI000E05026A|nr:restriction endonuclease subunit S [Streptococcus agalactiae]SUN10915.1 type I restriction-modification system, S subunit [Streptococcus agalactiae]VFA68221.1 Type I restriction-modification system, specificity subunit S [Streptococcus agalactiae]
MTPEQLKASILQRAMEGKLVPQDPTDEPASELLKRIKAEKEKLIADGKIKRDKKETELFRGADGKPYEKLADGTIQEVEVPYEIPESWEWVRLGCVASLSFFPNISGDKIPNCSWVLDMEDIEKETGRLLRKNYKTEKSSYKSNKVSFSQNAVLYAKLRPNLKKVIVADEDGFATTELIPIKLFGNTSPEYIKHCMVSPFYYFNIIQSVYGVKMPRVNSTFLSTTLIPLPPLAEQKRIVAQIEKALVKVDEYAESYNKLQQLDKEFPDKLKKSILQYAMQGKLVAQDPNDEPVEVLLEKIKSEKQKLYEEGKLKKKDLAEIVVTEGDDSSPYGKKTKFDIDFQRKSSWLLLPLEKIVRSIPTKNHQIKQSAIRETGRFPVVSQSQALVEGFSNDKTKILENTDSLIIFGDHTRTLKLIDFPFIIGADGVKVLQPIGISPQFLKYHLECTILFVKDRGYARHYSYLKNKIIGIPSELEQNKITKKVDLLFEKVALLKR